MNEFKEWLKGLEESQSMLMSPSTGQGGGSDNVDDDEGDDDDDDGWNWDRMEKYRWNILRWCGETESMERIVGSVAEMVAQQRSARTTYRINPSRMAPKYRYVLQLGHEFQMDMSSLGASVRPILERSDLYRAFNMEPNRLYRFLENDEVMEYMSYVICLYLSTQPSKRSSPFTHSHFGWKTESILSNHFSFNVWNRLKKGWNTRVLPQMSEIAIAARDKVERPSDWTKVGKPEVRAEFSDIKIAISVTVYDHENNSVLASVTVMIPFDWNMI